MTSTTDYSSGFAAALLKSFTILCGACACVCQPEAFAAQENADIVAVSKNRPPKTIGIVTDGQSRFMTPVEELVVQELQVLATNEFDLRIKRESAFFAKWELTKAKSALRAALADREVDLVLASGVLVTLAAATPDTVLAKPVISTFIQKSEAFGLSYTPTGKSEKPNLSFVVIPNAMATDLKSFRSLVPFSTLHVLVDEKILESLPLLEAETVLLREQLGMDLEMVPGPASLEGILRRIEACVPPRGSAVCHSTSPFTG